MERFVIRVDLLSQCFSFTEIHGRTFYRADLSGWNRLFICRGKRICIQNNGMAQSASALMSVQIEIAVIGHINDCIFIRHRLIMDRQRIILIQAVSHVHIQSTRIPLVAVRAVKAECDMVISAVRDLPHPFIIVVKTAVQIVSVIIFIQFVGHTVDHNRRSADPVCVSSHRCSDRISALLISGNIIEPQHHIHRLPAFSFHQDTDQGCAVIADCRRCPRIVFHHIQPGCISVLRLPEVSHCQFLHVSSPFPLFFSASYFFFPNQLITLLSSPLFSFCAGCAEGLLAFRASFMNTAWASICFSPAFFFR